MIIMEDECHQNRKIFLFRISSKASNLHSEEGFPQYFWNRNPRRQSREKDIVCQWRSAGFSLRLLMLYPFPWYRFGIVLFSRYVMPGSSSCTLVLIIGKYQNQEKEYVGLDSY
ncbi:LOW QUALITY PROTEIN: hypothetical protein PanWU01x14_367540 [Parasponia andersonii]|uniref:Uncharacterized protein n=1 Tax=Parasponia andersonii TaxID=3476 RepID=A0A2P5A5B2_PARAD|nr:LOW QUALITY PROTEIN: hypothetical protein PanWU01x14_367540 [Parasponia andersonii]